MRHNTGLVSVSFRAHTPREILCAMRDAGLSCIEWGSDVHAPCQDAARLDELVALQSEFGIFCCSYGTYFRLGVTPIAELEAYILAAKRLGTDILRLWCGTKSGADMTEGEITDLLANCRAAAEIAEKHGVTLCTECHMNTFTERPEDALWLMQAVNSSHFRTYWQPFQWRTVEQNFHYLRTLLPYVTHLHVFQWKQNERYSLCDGMDEWQGYLALLDAPHTLLLEFMPDDKLDTLCAEAKALRAIIGE
ncbi:MAG: sugar phosphate isomerase/epimerase [Clostridia bacterium]|nr:sugar phosphate isomerase/epimerase [Clostridia bacterium]